MIWFIIISLIVIGLILLVVEVIFVPGITIVGLIGVIFSITGIIMTYVNFGNTVGSYVLGGTLVSTALTLFLSFRSGVWKGFSLKSSIDSKVNEGSVAHLKVGDEGETLSALRPFGKARIGEDVFEVRTTGGYADANQKIRIIQIEGTQILVEIIN